MMFVTLTADQLRLLEPCDLDSRLRLFDGSKPMTVRKALKAGVSVSDILWVAGRLGYGTECAEFARNCADRARGYADAARHAAYSACSAAFYAAEVADYAAHYAALSADYAAASADYAASAEANAQKADLIRLFGTK